MLADDAKRVLQGMPRSLWTGSISFGLVTVPVKASTAVKDHDVHFHQLDKKSGSRIRYRKVAEERAGRVLDLMAVLEASVDAAKKRRTPSKATRKTTRKAG
jgi:non-homologous end joining protein Ku